jgi:hypothetical protein
MDQGRFDAMTRALTRVPSRRAVVRALAGAGLGLTAAPRPNVAAAKKRRRKKVQFNAFGCVDVGGFCKTDSQCCSNVCGGKQGKQGKKKCQAHDAQGCQPGARSLSCNPTGSEVTCTTSLGFAEGICETTTGGAAYCASFGDCYPCTKDADCQALPLCGPRAACIVCASCPAETGGTACVNPDPEGCTVPG